MNYWSRNKI